MQVRTRATLLKLREWMHALTLETQRASHTADTSDNVLSLATSRALEVLSRVSELVDAEVKSK